MDRFLDFFNSDDDYQNTKTANDCFQESKKHLHPGDICPNCGIGRIHYNTLLNLVCSKCNIIEAGVFT